MLPDLPQHLARQQQTIELQIRKAFKGVTREGGISWTETDVIDANGTQEERLQARASDREDSWEALIDDPNWVFGTSWGGYAFLDPIGFRYYLPPAMIRGLREGGDSSIAFFLKIDGEYMLERISLFTPLQSHMVARFIRFQIALHAFQNDEISGPYWTQAYTSHWRSKDRGTPLDEI